MGKSSNDPTLTPEELTGLRDEAASATAGCCTCTFRKDGTHGSSNKLVQMRADGTTPNGTKDNAFKAEIIIDQSGKDVHVLTRLKAVNATSDTGRYPETATMTDADLQARIVPIPGSIRTAWNAKPFKLKVTDSKCGENTFKVQFDAPFVASGHHYSLDFVNVVHPASNHMGVVPDYMGLTTGRSYMLPGSYTGKFNLGDADSATNGGESWLEAHEYGHMLGLIDEYLDIPLDFGGVQYTFYDGTSTVFANNDDLMCNVVVKTAQQPRFCLTVAYAVVAIFAQNGVTVTGLEIE